MWEGPLRPDSSPHKGGSHMGASPSEAGPEELMKIVRLAANELFVGKRANILRFDQDDLVRVLNNAFDDEKWFFGDQQSHSLK